NFIVFFLHDHLLQEALTACALTDQTIIPISAVLDALKWTRKDTKTIDPQVVTQASSLSRIPLDTSSLDILLFLHVSYEFTKKQIDDILRVLKPGGTVVFLVSAESAVVNEVSPLERLLMVTGFCELGVNQADDKSVVVTACKAVWKIGSSFALKKKNPIKSLPKVEINDDIDLIDEDSLLTEDDLKKPQLPVADDCEVGSTKKACKNCTCGRAEAEEKLPKLGLTMDQLNNPQSACGSCGLGDAFRCSTCPYKGLPTFKLGDKVSLSANFLAADI
ncbi:anamorsin homolog, partial [Impatiens glandulifera]|uniref:anamorsin homolog n=1 Tax=Impatiens glandulifera TaxID=253017 RepID=UPI001FB0A47E